MSRKKTAKPLTPEVPPLSPLPPPTQSLTNLWKLILGIIVVASIGLSLGHLTTTPVLPANSGSFINAPDEPAHIGYVKILAEERRLPTRDDSGSTYEWHQPPLYYFLTAPFYGLGPQAMRGVSLIFGLGSLAFIFLAVRRLFPNDAPLAVFAVGVAALIPMRQAVYTSVGNDALVELLFSATLYHLVLAFTNGFTAKRAGIMGALIGAAMLTKANGILLIPVVFVSLYFLWRGGESRASLGRNLIYLISLIICCTSLWYMRNLRLYHELTPITAFMHEFEGTSKASDWIGTPRSVDLVSGNLQPGDPMDRIGYLSLVGNWTFRTTFAAYTPLALASNGVPRFIMPPTFYLPYLLLLIGAFVGLTRLHFRRNVEFNALQISVVRLFWLAGILVALSFAGFIWTFFQAQGRYLYPAMLPISSLTALGCRSLIPLKYRDSGTLAVLGVLAILSLGFLLKYVIPAYKP